MQNQPISNYWATAEGQMSKLNSVLPELLDTFALLWLMHRDLIEWKNRLEVDATAARVGIQIYLWAGVLQI